MIHIEVEAETVSLENWVTIFLFGNPSFGTGMLSMLHILYISELTHDISGFASLITAHPSALHYVIAAGIL